MVPLFPCTASSVQETYTYRQHWVTCNTTEVPSVMNFYLHQWGSLLQHGHHSCSNWKFLERKELGRCLHFTLTFHCSLCSRHDALWCVLGLNRSLSSLWAPFSLSLKSQVQMLETVRSLEPGCLRESELLQPCLQCKENAIKKPVVWGRWSEITVFHHSFTGWWRFQKGCWEFIHFIKALWFIMLFLV